MQKKEKIFDFNAVLLTTKVSFKNFKNIESVASLDIWSRNTQKSVHENKIQSRSDENRAKFDYALEIKDVTKYEEIKGIQQRLTTDKLLCQAPNREK